ncbi:MAG: hypothetical protein NTU83_09370 [Candidatus Hydrogenedentes bacterium]|nr:hypothetical protein [Candidatus Hydrogenedentota bacterium]
MSARIPGLQKLGEASGIKRTDDEQIAGVMDDVALGMQSRRIYKVLAHVSRTYHDAEGRDYTKLEEYLNEIFRVYRTIRITRVVPRITIEEGVRARAVETFGTVAEPLEPNLEPPINLQGQVVVNLVKVGGEWQIVEWGSIL